MPVTASATAFADEGYRILTLLLYLGHADKALLYLRKTLAESDEPYPLKLRQALSIDGSPARPEEIDGAFQRHLVNEMLMCRIVDNFLCYVSGLLTEIFKHRPEALRSKETITWEFALGFDDMTSFRHALADLKVDRLAYAGVEELVKKCSSDLGLLLVEDDETVRVSEAVEIRNLVVHNRGVVNARAARKAPALASRLGNRLQISIPELMQAWKLFTDIAKRTDARAQSKFSLQATTGYVHPQIAAG